MAMLGKRRQPLAKRSPAKPRAATPGESEAVTIERLAHDGRGVARDAHGKTLFVDGALPGERVTLAIHRQRRRFDEAHVRERLNAAVDRVEPPCEYFARCGGCDLQHLQVSSQREHKQSVLAEMLAHQSIATLADGAPVASRIELLAGAESGYRRRARLSVKRDPAGGIHLGFRARSSDQLVDIDHCHVLAAPLSRLLPALRMQLEALEVVRHVGHLELLLGEGERAVVIVRQLRDVSEDADRWRDFAEREGVVVGQLKGRESPTLTWLGETPPLSVGIEGASGPVVLGVAPGDFLQINAEINQRLIDTARDWLALSGREHLLDLFAGIGNFSLALAGDAASVTAVEGSQSMVERLRANAANNGLSNVTSRQADLGTPGEVLDAALACHDTVLLDPPRSGADAVCRALASSRVERVLYVSCHAASLARDLATLTQSGFSLERLALADMFPHTAHLEAMALLTRRCGADGDARLDSGGMRQSW